MAQIRPARVAECEVVPGAAIVGWRIRITYQYTIVTIGGPLFVRHNEVRLIRFFGFSWAHTVVLPVYRGDELATPRKQWMAGVVVRGGGAAVLTPLPVDKQEEEKGDRVDRVARALPVDYDRNTYNY